MRKSQAAGNPSAADEDAGPRDVVDAGARERDAGQKKPAAPADAGTRTSPAEVDASKPDVSASSTPNAQSCTRAFLRERAQAYFSAMTAGDTTQLSLHPSLRYTENGAEVVLGLGLWLEAPEAELLRHVFDEVRCGSVSEAVIRSLRGRSVVAIRVLYTDSKLIEAEAHIATGSVTVPVDPDGVLPGAGPDPWASPIAANKRMSRDALQRLAEQYFDTATGSAPQPASGPGCERRQNGVLMAQAGSCQVPAGDMRYTQRRYPVVDEEAGIASAFIGYNNRFGVYLFKASGNVIDDIEVIGGTTAGSSGW
jgi:hypothetical protein